MTAQRLSENDARKRMLTVCLLASGTFFAVAGVAAGQQNNATLDQPLSANRSALTGAQTKEVAPVGNANRRHPDSLLHFDDFEYQVNRNEINPQPAFITRGKWSSVKAINTGRNAAGYLYTVDRIPGYSGNFPGQNSRYVLAIEALPGTFQTQTDLYLQYGNPEGPPNQVPGNVWFQFWVYLNYYDDPQDKNDQLSGITNGKFLYPSVNGTYPAHPLWLFTIRHSSYVFLKGEKEPREIDAPSYQEMLLHAESLGREGPYANIKKGPDYNRWKLGQTSLEERIVANRWTLVKLHFDTSTTSARYEAWLRPLGGRTVKVAEWIDEVTPDFSWQIPPDKVGGHKVFRMPTTLGADSSWGDRAKNNKDCWIYLDDFAMAEAEEALPTYPH